MPSSSSMIQISSLHRYAVKGLGGDTLEQVCIGQAGETFPDDRRYALLWKTKKWNSEEKPEWRHKENFLCAFTDPRLMSSYESSYDIIQPGEKNEMSSYGTPCDTFSSSGESARLLTLRERETQRVVLERANLATTAGREQLAHYFSEVSGESVLCVASSSSSKHMHQFGNTSSGVKSRGDTRTVHIVNAATVRDLSETLGVPLNPTRFRPNIVIDGLEAWSEFEWIGKQIQCGQTKMSVISRTVRCNGVSIDPLDPDRVLDIPKLLAKNYPQYGPYLGVYAMLDTSGIMAVGDGVTCLN